MGNCNCLKKKENQVLDSVPERISTRTLNENADPSRSSLKKYLDSNRKQIIIPIRDVYLKVINDKILMVKVLNDKINLRQAKFLTVALRYCTSLEILNLRNNDLGDEGACLLSTIFEHTTHLTELIIEDNHIREKGLKEICRTLHNLTSLKILSLSHNVIGSSVESLSKVLPFLDNLLEIYLEVMEISSSDFNTLSLELADCKKLKKLGLGHNKLDSGCLAALTLLLSSLPDLHECILSGIEIADVEIDKLIIAFMNLKIKI